MNNLPVFTRKYFWDVNPDTLDNNRHQQFIVERLLEYGDLDSIDWLNNNFPKSTITQVIKTSKRISPKTGNYFAIYYNLPKDQVLCMRTRSIQKQNKF